MLSALLDRMPTLKARLSVIILAGIASAIGVVTLGRGLGVPWLAAAALGASVSLTLVHFVAKGTTARLRELADAAELFATGRHDHRVQVTTKDEVGHLSESFNTMANQIEATDRFRRDLVANASHELRTPVAATRAVLENMVDGLQEPTPETLRPVLDQVIRLGALVDQLFDLSKLESGKDDLIVEPVDLLLLAIHVACAGGLRSVPVAALSDGPFIVMGDDNRLQQVLTNLLENAYRYTPPTVVRDAVRVDLRADDLWVTLRVLDSGPGIAPEMRARVFERFVRGPDARSVTANGAGLGLSIVKSIVDAHHGHVSIEDANPQSEGTATGCCVVVKLPRHG